VSDRIRRKGNHGLRALGVAVAAFAGLLSRIQTATGRPRVLIWGVAISPDLDLVLASDINGGLYILRPIGL